MKNVRLLSLGSLEARILMRKGFVKQVGFLAFFWSKLKIRLTEILRGSLFQGTGALYEKLLLELILFNLNNKRIFGQVCFNWNCSPEQAVR